jgi:hypothetical protein
MDGATENETFAGEEFNRGEEAFGVGKSDARPEAEGLERSEVIHENGSTLPEQFERIDQIVHDGEQIMAGIDEN